MATEMTTHSSDLVRWHVYREWQDGGYRAVRPRGITDPCGDCGKAMADHPFPVSKVFDNVKVGRILVAVEAVIREWDERGDGGCQVLVQNQLREAVR